MVAAARYSVDYQATTLSTRIHDIGPIKTFAGPPPAEYQPAAVGFAGQLNGINQMVCTYHPFQWSHFYPWLTPTNRQLGRCSALRGLFG